MDSESLVLHLETIAVRAWPAAVRQPLGGWLLRYADGVTGRANSVWPNGAVDGAQLPGLVNEVERFYAARQLPARFQITPAQRPRDLSSFLAGRGYQAEKATDVQIAAAAVVSSLDRPVTVSVDCGDRLTRAWHERYTTWNRFSPFEAGVRFAIINRIPAPVCFLTATIHSSPAGIALVAADGAWAGIFGMIVDPEQRQRGVGRALLAAGAAWAASQNVVSIYLQVMQNNTPAQALYAGAGFRPLYTYRYWVKPV